MLRFDRNWTEMKPFLHKFNIKIIVFEHQEKMVTSNYDAFLDNNMCKNSNFVIGIFKYRIRQGPVLPYYQHILDLL